MKIKTPIEFLTFNDGVVDICDVDDYGKPLRKGCKRCHFGNQKIGITRYFAARQNDIEINKVIHIHKDLSITTDKTAIIKKTVFKIEQVQHDDYTNPKSTVLTLSQRGIYEGMDDGVS